MPALPGEPARLGEDAALSLPDVHGTEPHRSGGVEEPAVTRAQDGQAGPPECRIEAEGPRAAGRVPGAQTFMLIGQVWANHHVMFDHIRHADRLILFLNTVLLMDIAFLPFAAAVLASSFRHGQGERAAVVLHGIAFELAAALFNAIWRYARHDHRLLADTIDPAGVRAISRRFRLALAWLGAGTLLGALLPALGVGVIAAFIVYYWLPISGEIGHQPRTARSTMAAQRGTRLTSSATRSRKTNHRTPAR